MRTPGGIGVQAVHAGCRARPRLRAAGTVLVGPVDDDDPRPAVLGATTVSGQPTNAGDSSAGTVDLYGATVNSVNTVYAQLVTGARRRAGRRRSTWRTDLGIQSELPAVCSITLGSVQINPLEMTNAYATLAADGVYHRANPSARGRPAERPAGRSQGRVAPEGSVQGRHRCATGGHLRAAGRRPRRHRLGGIDLPVARRRQDRAARRTTSTRGSAATPCSSRRASGSATPRSSGPLINIAGVPTVYGGTIPAAIWHDFMLEAMAYGEEEWGWEPLPFSTDFSLTGTLGAPTPVASPTPPAVSVA